MKTFLLVLPALLLTGSLTYLSYAQKSRPAAVSTKKAAPRSDSEIAAKVKAELARRMETAAAVTDVRVVHGTVSIEGNATTDAERSAAERIASKVPGVRRVDYRLNPD